MADNRRDRAIVERTARWFRANARPLPWRATGDGRRDPYRSLVSEIMLQQTQVARALEKYDGFVRRFPTVQSLARAREQSVLAAWSGLGYYRRARFLHAAAKEIVARYAGEVPRDADALRTLPGVGRYTAGALASVVFEEPAAIVDANVARVLVRVEGQTLDPATGAGAHWLWERAGSLAQRAARTDGAGVAAFNEGLMELGAVVCRPAAPGCGACPLRTLCLARRRGLVDVIPPAKRAANVLVAHHDCALFEDARGRRLVERRGPDGLWAGLWQPPTLESAGRAPTRRQVRAWAGSPVRAVASFERRLSHRLVRFRVWRADGAGPPAGASGVWRTQKQIRRLALSNPHRRVLLGM